MEDRAYTRLRDLITDEVGHFGEYSRNPRISRAISKLVDNRPSNPPSTIPMELILLGAITSATTAGTPYEHHVEELKKIGFPDYNTLIDTILGNRK